MHIHHGFKICSVWGPFSINFYGFFIALALVICTKLLARNPRYIQLHLQNKFVDILCVSIIAGIIGGRILAILSAPHLYPHMLDWFSIWQGGFSALGSILGVILVTPFYIKTIGLPILPIFDLAALYAPLFQAIARIGCLFAGCCHGIPTHSFFHILYTHADTIALRNIPLHPTQLYSSLLLFMIFLFLFFVIQHRVKYSGQIFCTYLALAALERFIIDFLRADRIILQNSFLSFHQYVAIAIFCVTIMAMFSQKIQGK